MARQSRYHVQHGEAVRTTVSLDNVLSSLLALKLGHEPGTKDAHAAVRQWLQDRLDQAADPGRKKVSQWLAGEGALLIADKKISESYLKWLTGI